MHAERSELTVTCSCSREKFGENRQIRASLESGLYATASVSEDELCEKCMVKQLLNSVFA